MDQLLVEKKRGSPRGSQTSGEEVYLFAFFMLRTRRLVAGLVAILVAILVADPRATLEFREKTVSVPARAAQLGD